MSQVISEKQASELLTKINSGERCQLVDVREPVEYQKVHVAGSRSLPLSKFNIVSELIQEDLPIYLICHSGPRATQAATQLSQLGFKDINVIKGGLDALIAAGYAIEKGTSSPWSLDRQVRFTSGLLILVGIALAYTVSANWICLSAFIVLGMLFSALTDTCGMGMILSKMPWNRSCGE